jgi:hypothetical protein
MAETSNLNLGGYACTGEVNSKDLIATWLEKSGCLIYFD